MQKSSDNEVMKEGLTALLLIVMIIQTILRKVH